MDKVNESILTEGMVEGRVIPNGVSLEEFYPGDIKDARNILGLLPEEFILLFAANGIKNNMFKDFKTLRDAFDLLAEKIKTPVKIIALGEDADDEFFGNITICYIPHTHDKRLVRAYYQAADIYLHAARAENFPNTILEAMACGKPIIATKIGGIPEQVVDGETGILVPCGRPEEFASAILKLMNNPIVIQDMGARSHLRVREKFSLQMQAKRYLSWFEEILKNYPQTRQ